MTARSNHVSAASLDTRRLRATTPISRAETALDARSPVNAIPPFPSGEGGSADR